MTPEDRSRLSRAARIEDAAEMLWVVLANVSGGDWKQQPQDWQEAAARWRDNYFEALAAQDEAPTSPATETFTDSHRQTLEWLLRAYTHRETKAGTVSTPSSGQQWQTPIALAAALAEIDRLAALVEALGFDFRTHLQVNAHTLTIKFHRFLSHAEWQEAAAAVDHHVPYVQELEANAVHETPEELARRRPLPARAAQDEAQPCEFVFSCPNCGHPGAQTVEPSVDIHSGATFTCDECGGKVIFTAQTTDEYVRRPLPAPPDAPKET